MPEVLLIVMLLCSDASGCRYVGFRQEYSSQESCVKASRKISRALRKQGERIRARACMSKDAADFWQGLQEQGLNWR